MSKIKYINSTTDLSKIDLMSWDVVVNGEEYAVYSVPGYAHTIKAYDAQIDTWCCKRTEIPSFETLIPFNSEIRGAAFGIKFEPKNIHHFHHGEHEIEESRRDVIITRNGEDFACTYSIESAKYMIDKYLEHPLDLNFYGFKEKMIGRKVWYRSQPAIITKFMYGDDRYNGPDIVLEPDGIDEFSIPKEYIGDDSYIIYEEDKRMIITSILDEHIWYWRQ